MRIVTDCIGTAPGVTDPAERHITETKLDKLCQTNVLNFMSWFIEYMHANLCHWSNISKNKIRRA